MTLARLIAGGAIVGLAAIAACATYSTDASLDCVVPDGQACATYPLCGCPSGYNCALIGSGTAGQFTCVNGGSLQVNGRCTVTGDCAAGLGCAFAENSSVGVCMPYASTDDPGSCPNGHAIAGKAPVCAAYCAPWDPQSCGTGGAGCTFTSLFGASDPKPTFCTAVGTGAGVGACPGGKSIECAPGFGCLTQDKSCRKFCRTADDCLTGKACSMLPSVSYDGVPIGFCAP